MKKNIFKILTLISSFAIFFVSCGFDAKGIFSEIRNEVALDDANIYGRVGSVVRYNYDGKETVFVSNYKIYYRNVSTSEDSEGNTEDADGNAINFSASVANSKIKWTDFEKPSGIVIALAADAENLYALSVPIEDDDDGDNVPTKAVLYCYSDSGWQPIWEESSFTSTEKVLLCTNAPKNGNRKAYFRYGTTVWELNGTTELAATETDSDGNVTTAGNEITTGEDDNSTTPTTSVKTCAYFNGSVYFSSAYAMITNETFEDDATYIYYSSGDNVYYSTDGENWNSVDLDCSTIYSLGFSKNYILAGTSSGIYHTELEPDANDIVAVPSNGNTDFDTNAQSALSTYYHIENILVVDPSRETDTKTADDGTVFASSITDSSSASLKNVGLWGYYASKAEWNRE